VAEDLGHCKHCKFPVNTSYIKKMIGTEGIDQTCPMCNVEITMDDIVYTGEAGVAALKRAPAKDEKEK
jgi:NAD-dependent SIR2 family protein deacetylase